MQVVESQIYEGEVSALGGEGPAMRWIVVSPFGKTHAHSIDDPRNLHCMPLGILQRCIDEARLKHVDTRPNHPAIQLQRAKEERGLRDTHMGLHGDLLDLMLRFLRTAVAEHAEYAPFLAGEITALLATTELPADEIDTVRAEVAEIIGAK